MWRSFQKISQNSCARANSSCVSFGVRTLSMSADAVGSSRSEYETVVHNRAQKKFILNIEGSSEPARIEYRVLKPGVIDLYHTEVPDEFRGRGIAKKLAAGAFEHVKKENLRMKLSCWYLQTILTQNPKSGFAALLDEN
ncbi:unnamed protein product [Notodromas monacha]|uniref:Protein NATD1 n=1 Tax=Notodromas monacha TaxID=399045 RepID=A0A7R9GCR1_9CRUS|nr:unnamed protein product [Notodromas monacha]CAG0917916.1 unnamed protein product [Notodromas monacha]